MYKTYISVLLLFIISISVIIQYIAKPAAAEAAEHFINKPITISENVLNIDAKIRRPHNRQWQKYSGHRG